MKKIIIILFTLVTSQLFAQNIVLDPNTSFFSPRGTLKLYGETIVNDAYNRNKHYERIGDWKVATDSIVWGVKDLQAGMLNIELFAGISTTENNSEVTLFIDNQQQDLVVSATTNLQDFQSQGTVSFQITQPGFHEIKLKIKTQNSTNDFGEIEKLVLTGPATNGAAIYRRRWRPAAVHGRFLSPNNTNTEITVYKVTVLSKVFNSYQVMMTEFGYIGSSNDKNKQGIAGLNFSLWSYGANDPEPPHTELSHLIAVGGAGNGFGRYGHEGTGVKPRGFDPYNAPVENSFLIALRKEPGVMYNTYWCYYFDTVDTEWKLYGAGKKRNNSGNLDYLNTTGGFLEVGGPTHTARSGHRLRKVEFQGWRMQHDGTWNTINELDPIFGGQTAISYKEWAQNSTGDAFVFKSGGFSETGPNPGNITLTNPPALPYYLQNNYANQLYKMPADFTTSTPEVFDTNAVLKFNIQNLGTNPEIKVFYGTNYGLTEGIDQNYVIDAVWQEEQSVPLNAVNNGILSVSIPNLLPNTQYFYRLRIKNDEGITWSFNTESFTTQAVLSTIDISQAEKGFAVYPNPTNAVLNIDNQLDVVQAKLYNLKGQFILSQKVANHKISIQSLENGVYFLKLVTTKGIKVIKVIKK